MFTTKDRVLKKLVSLGYFVVDLDLDKIMTNMCATKSKYRVSENKLGTCMLVRHVPSHTI